MEHPVILRTGNSFATEFAIALKPGDLGCRAKLRKVLHQLPHVIRVIKLPREWGSFLSLANMLGSVVFTINRESKTLGALLDRQPLDLRTAAPGKCSGEGILQLLGKEPGQQIISFELEMRMLVKPFLSWDSILCCLGKSCFRVQQMDQR